jgi:hypothetical protein
MLFDKDVTCSRMHVQRGGCMADNMLLLVVLLSLAKAGQVLPRAELIMCFPSLLGFLDMLKTVLRLGRQAGGTQRSVVHCAGVDGPFLDATFVSSVSSAVLNMRRCGSSSICCAADSWYFLIAVHP